MQGKREALTGRLRPLTPSSGTGSARKLDLTEVGLRPVGVRSYICQQVYLGRGSGKSQQLPDSGAGILHTPPAHHRVRHVRNGLRQDQVALLPSLQHRA